MKHWKRSLVALSLLTLPLVAQAQQVVYSYSVPLPGPGVGYDPTGNLLSYADNVNGNWTMTYDQLNRLQSATAASGPYQNLSLSMLYDSFGNRKYQTSSGTPPSGPIDPAWANYNANNHITASNAAAGGAVYDSAGNVKFDGSNQIAYDADNHICAIYNEGGSVIQYLYDAEGRRVAKGHSVSAPSQLACSTGGADFQPTETYVLGQSGEQLTQLDSSGGWQHTNVYVVGSLLATYDNRGSGLHFHVEDPLGTRRVQVSSIGIVELNCSNLPFGDGLSCNSGGSDATEQHFTGKERDTESGLDYFGARYYGSSMGRFMSPDEPFVDQSPSDPQSWNLYAYGRNNPVTNTDPTGQDCIYGDGNGGGYLLRGDCASDSDNGIFVNGTVDANSFKYNPSNNSSSFSYTPDGAGPGAIGTGVIQGPNLNGGFASGSLAAGVFGAGSASTWNNAAGVVNAAGTAELYAAGMVSTPAALALALTGCASGGSNAGCGASMAMALLPEVAALREGAAVLRAGRGLNAAEILQKSGGFSQALKDFEALPGKETIMGEMRTKTLLDGTKVTVRDFSKAGPPTLQLNAPSGVKTEYRY